MVAWLLRAPNAIYSAHAGRLLGHRFLQLTHRGRRTGQSHATVLEVLWWDRDTREVVVMSGWGRKANWYRNVLAAGVAEVTIGAERWPARVRALGPAEAAAVLADYEHRNRFMRPIVRRLLGRLADIEYDGSENARHTLALRLPLVAFTPDRPRAGGE